jgi:hypothetical protein
MQTITRHGGGSHYVRPDRVYRTGVITSTMGYDPNSDVQDVAAAMTAYPMDLPTPASMSFGGLGGFGAFGASMGFLQRAKLRFEAWKARKRAQQYMTAASRLGMRGWNYRDGMSGLGNGQDGDARNTGVAYPQIGRSIAPEQVGKHDMALVLMNGGIQDGLAIAQAGFSWDYWINQRWNG